MQLCTGASSRRGDLHSKAVMAQEGSRHVEPGQGLSYAGSFSAAGQIPSMHRTRQLEGSTRETPGNLWHNACTRPNSSSSRELVGIVGGAGAGAALPRLIRLRHRLQSACIRPKAVQAAQLRLGVRFGVAVGVQGCRRVMRGRC